MLIEDSAEDYAAIVRALRLTAHAVTLKRCAQGEQVLDFLWRRGATKSS